jgi:CheY-like chemotaxis protein
MRLGIFGGMDGFAVARAFRAHRMLRKIRLVATSGYSSPDHANVVAVGFDSLAVKPLTEENLRGLIH